MKKASLTVVGSGIKALSHLSSETKTYIQYADKVLYSINEPVTQEWIIKNAKSSESLDDLYFAYAKRIDAYHAITSHILDNLRADQNVCVVMYGHPCFYAKPGLDAVIQARAEGYDARILPSISAEDCLFTDLLIDPGSFGCQSYDATDFLIYKHTPNINAHLILYQPSAIGASGQSRFHSNNENITILIDYLSAYYSLDHLVILYAAAQYPGLSPSINEIKIRDLQLQQIKPIETLYIPPVQKADLSLEMLDRLSINLSKPVALP